MLSSGGDKLTHPFPEGVVIIEDGHTLYQEGLVGPVVFTETIPGFIETLLLSGLQPEVPDPFPILWMQRFDPTPIPHSFFLLPCIGAPPARAFPYDSIATGFPDKLCLHVRHFYQHALLAH